MFELSAKLTGDRKRFEKILADHPITLSFLLCLFLCSVSFMEQYEITGRSVFTVFAALLVLSLAFCVYFRAALGLKTVYSVLSFAVLALLSFLICYRLGVSKRKTVSMLIFCVIILLTVTIALAATKKLTVAKAVTIIFIGAVFLRFTYVSITSISTRCHDVVNRAGTNDPYTEGHMGYILYLFRNDFALPDVISNGRLHDQFYHPPLHHLIAAVWLKILSFFGITDKIAYSSIQTLTLFYSLVSTVYAYRILGKFKIDDKIKVFLFLVVAFHPSFVYMSADINNDMLSVAFSFAAIYYALCWWDSRKLRDILLVALSIGLGMATKLSVYLIAVPVAVIFAVAFFADLKSKKPIKTLITQFVVFALVCAPLGLFSPIKNAIKFGLPLTFVQKLPDDSWQYVGNYSVTERLFDFKSLFTSIYDQWPNRAANMTYHEYNPLVALIKTSVFEEYINNSGSFAQIDFWAHVLYVSNIALIVISLVCAVYSLIYRIMSRKADLFGTVIAIGYLSMLVSFYIFCFQYPHHCTENMRYVTPLIVYGAIFIGNAFKNYDEQFQANETSLKIGRYVKIIFIVFSVLFALASFGLVVKLGRA